MEQSATNSVFRRIRALSTRRFGLFSAQIWCLLTLIPLILYTFNLGGARALTQHEIFVAGPAKQMMQQQDWLLPRIGDQLWLEKPPLPHWLAAVSSWIAGGFSEASVRLPSALAGVGVVLLVAGLMAKLFGTTIGWLSGIVQACSMYMLAYARLAEADMLLLLMTMTAIVVFIHLQHLPEECTPRRRRLWLWSFWALIGLTNLAKGMLFGAGLTLITCIGWLIVSRDWRNLRQLWSPVGFILAAGIALAWPVGVFLEEPAALELWTAHLFGRAAGNIGYTKPFWYYLTTWPTQLLPWTPLLFMGAGASLRRAGRDGKSPDRFIWWWAGCQLCLLSLSGGKHHHYLIYALPAMSPVIAMGLLRSGEITMARGRWTLNWGKFLCGGVAPAVVIAGGVAGIYAGEFRSDVWALSAILAAGCLGFGLFTIRGLPVPTFACFLTAVLLANLYVQGWVMPRRDPSADDKRFLIAVDRELPPDVRVIAVGEPEIARHIFYMTRQIDGVWNAGDIGNLLDGEDVFFAITRQRNRAALQQFGRTTKMKQSQHTRRETVDDDRYTLYRVDVRPPAVAVGTQHQRQ
jgi:4-amino-4-deoxy-L-arabinose transferase-like glycosyltransferase